MRRPQGDLRWERLWHTIDDPRQGGLRARKAAGPSATFSSSSWCGTESGTGVGNDITTRRGYTILGWVVWKIGSHLYLSRRSLSKKPPPSTSTVVARRPARLRRRVRGGERPRCRGMAPAERQRRPRPGAATGAGGRAGEARNPRN